MVIHLLRMTTLDGCVREIPHEPGWPPCDVYALPLAPGLEGVMGRVLLPQSEPALKKRMYRATGQTIRDADFFNSYIIHVYIEAPEL
jgi:hypothetical protein